MTDAPATPAAESLGAFPPVLAGPLLRHVSVDKLTLWLVGSCALTLRLTVTVGDNPDSLITRALTDEELRRIPLGEHAVLHLIEVGFEPPLPQDTRIGYNLGVKTETGTANAPADEAWIADWAPHLCLPGAAQPDYVIKDRLDRLYHGSCRRPHDTSADGLVRIDAELQATGTDIAARPALMMMTGDQIYADDVAGPMLRTIHALIEKLGLFDESIEGAIVADSRALRSESNTYYFRERILPENKNNEALLGRLFGGARKPIFTTSNAQNHLISLAEIIAMYLLVWSPTCWQLVQISQPPLPTGKARRYCKEREQIERFVAGLPRAARALAHIPTYMMFDDHDVTDDWNLSASWESTIYEHPFSRRIVGNALIGYLLCQAWGNQPAAFAELMPSVEKLLHKQQQSALLDSRAQNELIDRLLRFQQWHYTLNTSPKLVVLDTRTHRWRRETRRSRPSGLMDWEALTEFQQSIMGEKAVVVVSPAPIFGVKLIEIIQRIFTYFGKPLVVDAENWMAHRDTASALLNIFGHSGTPEIFVILSGDVHYSFVYDVRLRHRTRGPKIWQITSSGIKSQFPKLLLEWLDRANRWLYAPWSPMNWFTQRRRMRITPREPTGRQAGERLWNRSGIGSVNLDEHGVPVDIRQLNADSGETQFLKGKKSRYD